MTRILPVLLGLALLVAACGGGDELTMAEYVDEIDVVFDQAVVQYEAIVASPEGGVLIVGQGDPLGLGPDGPRLTDFSPIDLHVSLNRVAAIQDEAMAAASAIEPPEAIAELHDLYFGTALPIAELAARAATAADWNELSDSAEMAAYRTALAADLQVCADFQAKLDALAQQGTFADVPWMPGQLTDIADYALGCDVMPTNPENVFRP